MAQSELKLRLVQGGPAPQAVERTSACAPAIERACAGDRDATRALLRLVGPAVQRTAKGVLGSDHPDLDDAIQEALIGLVRALPAFRGDCPLHGFAIRITSRVCFGVLRKRARRQRLTQAAVTDAEPVVDPQHELVRGDVLRILRGHLLELRPEQAETVMLRWVLGHSLGDVSRITGVPINTVRSRLRLARNALADRLQASQQWREVIEHEEAPR